MREGGSVLQIVRQAFDMVPPELRRWWLAVPALAVLTGAAEAGAAAAVFGLIKIISAPAQVAEIPVAAWLAAHLPPRNAGGLILQFAVIVSLYHVAKNVLVAAAQYVQHRIVGGSSAALAGTMLRGYLMAPYPFHFRRHSAELIRNTTHSVTAVFRALSAAAAVFSETLIGGAVVVVLLAAAPGATLLAGAALATVLGLLLPRMRRLAQRKGTEQHALDRELLQTLQHAFGAIKEIKTLGREEFFYRSYVDAQRRQFAIGYASVTLQAIPPLVVETVFVAGALLVIAVLTLTGQVAVDGLPLLALFAYAGFRLIPMANRITWRLNEIRASAAAVAALHDDHQLVTASPTDDPGGDGTAASFASSIALENLTYTYPGAREPALRDVTLTVRHGESLAIVGPTGAGKSTLVDVIVGLLPPTSGRLLVDDVPLGPAQTRLWRRRIGYVPQSIVLLDDSLRRNIALGIAEADIDAARLDEAVRIAQLAPLIDSLPDGLATQLGERGVRLSGGERQRVGVARALYHDPDLLVFDEATAALDTPTAAAMNSAVRALHGTRTIVIIAHRLSSIAGCDRIALVVDGRVVDCGTYPELHARSAEFRRLAAAAPPA